MVAQARVSTKSLIASCQTCGSVFDITNHMAKKAEAGAAPREQRERPPHVRVDWGSSSKGGRSTLTVHFRSLSRPVVFLLTLAPVALIFGVVVFGTVEILPVRAGVAVVMLASAVAIVAGIRARMAITVDDEHLSVRAQFRSQPHLSIPITQIGQLFVIQFPPTQMYPGGGSHLRVRLVDGTESTLAFFESPPPDAIYIEQLIEKHLGMVDRPTGSDDEVR